MSRSCPWVNNCVGVGNHKLFLLFIFWINVISCYALVLIIAKHLTCSMWRSHAGCRSSPRSFVITIFLVVEAVLFGACCLELSPSHHTPPLTALAHFCRVVHSVHVRRSDPLHHDKRDADR